MTRRRDWQPPLDERLRDIYLRRLGWTEPPEVSVDTLFALNRAQVDRVPYETTWVWLGETRTVNAIDSVRYIAAGRGGYCYHMNGSLSTLLAWLGFDVHWRVGGVQGEPEAEAGVSANHLVIEIHGLPTGDNPDGRWLVDTGLGDGPYEPLPLAPGEYRQGAFSYQLSHSDVADGGWRLDPKPQTSLVGMDFAPQEAKPEDFVDKHHFLSTSPESGFVKILSAYHRDPNGFDLLRGRMLQRYEGADKHEIELATRADWYAALADTFNLTLSDVDEQRKGALWEKVSAAHDAWRESVVVREG
jgi:N-hydroxyarylamine O-acetyltransferase